MGLYGSNRDVTFGKLSTSFRRECAARGFDLPERPDYHERKRSLLSLLFYYGSTYRVRGTAHEHTWPRSVLSRSRSSRSLITYLAERSVVFAVAVGCRPLLRCSRCGCPAEYYDHCHCSSPNLRTRPQDTSITTTRSSREESRPDTLIAKRTSVRYFLARDIEAVKHEKLLMSLQ